MILSPNQDAQGREMYDYYKGNRDVFEIIERDDGFIEAYAGPRDYLSEFKDWGATPWFDYLLVSKNEMTRLVKGTGWTIRKFIESNGPQYIAIYRARLIPLSK